MPAPSNGAIDQPPSCAPSKRTGPRLAADGPRELPGLVLRSLNVLRVLPGHQHMKATMIYAHLSTTYLRAALPRVGTQAAVAVASDQKSSAAN